MKRKFLTLLLAIVALVSFTLAFTACGGKKDPEDPPAHECEFETEWSYDATHHWHDCKGEECEEVSGKAPHDFDGNTCIICDYVNPSVDPGTDPEDPTDPEPEVPAEVIGFDAAESVVVTTGTKVILEKPSPVDQNGTNLDVYFDVTDKDGGHITTFSDGDNEYFIAGGVDYVITYAVYPYDKAVTVKTTEVKVVGAATVDVEYDSVVEIGKEITINAESGFYVPNFTYTVSKKDGSVVTVTDGKFTPDTVGVYTVKVAAESLGKTAEKTYEIYARNVKKTGEIETFSADWEDLREFNGFDTRGWTITDSEKAGLLNYKGESDTYITYNVPSATTRVGFYLDTLYTHDEYLAMVGDGYTRLTFKVYIDANALHGLKYHTDLKIDGSLSVALDDLVPNTWNTVNIYFSHVEHSGCLDRNFLTGFVLWDAQEIPFIEVMNGAGEDFTIYIDDIFATKDATPTENTDASKEFEVGSSYDLTSIVNEVEGVAYNYLIKNNSAKEDYVLVSDPTAYKFTASGDYQIKVIPTEYYYRGQNEFSFIVTDDITVKKAWNKIQMTGTSLAVNLADVDAVLMNGTTAIDTKVSGVWFHDDYMLDTITDAGFTVDKAGYYKIYLEGTYGDGYKTYKSVDLDVWTEESQYMMALAEDFVATRYWAYNNLPNSEVGEYEIDGATVRAFKYSGKNAGAIMFRPMFSKSYYEELNSQFDALVNFETYYEHASKNCYTKLMPKKIDYNNRNVWNSQEIELSWFIENYDTIVMSFNDVYANYLAGGNPTIAYGNYFNNGADLNAKYKSYIYMLNSNNTNSANIYVKDLSIKAMFVDETEYLVDVNGMTDTTYDITKSFGEKGKSMLDMYKDATLNYVLTDVRGNTLNSNVVDITEAENLRAWSIEIYNGDAVVYRGTIDLYDSTKAIVWDDDTTGVGTWSLFGMSGGGMNACGNGADATLTRDDKSVSMKFFNKSLYAGKYSALYFVIKPIHTKSYYELFVDDGIKINFSVYIGVDSGVVGFAQFWLAGKSGTVATDGNMSSQWYDLSIDLSTLLNKWSYVEFEDATYSWSTRKDYGFIYFYNPQNHSQDTHQGIYLGNFSITQA